MLKRVLPPPAPVAGVVVGGQVAQTLPGLRVGLNQFTVMQMPPSHGALRGLMALVASSGLAPLGSEVGVSQPSGIESGQVVLVASQTGAPSVVHGSLQGLGMSQYFLHMPLVPVVTSDVMGAIAQTSPVTMTATTQPTQKVWDWVASKPGRCPRPWNYLLTLVGKSGSCDKSIWGLFKERGSWSVLALTVTCSCHSGLSLLNVAGG